MHKSVWFVAVVCGMTGFLSIARAAEPRIHVDQSQRAVTIETSRLRATFQDGMIVSLVNLATGEQHADPAQADAGMPRGMGHMRGGIAQMQRIHVPWRNATMTLPEDQTVVQRPDQRDFPNFYRPHEASVFTTDPIDRGIEMTWAGLTNGQDQHSGESLTIRVWVEQGTEHLAFQAIARSDDKGVFGVQVPLANLADYHQFYIPSFSGVMIDRRARTGLMTYRGLGNFLEARVVGIEGQAGSVGLWAQDEQFYNHYLFHNWSGRTFSLAFEHLNLMPFEQHDQIASVIYYLDVFAGGWVDAMTPYRNWYRDLFADEMQQRAAVQWADRIRVIVDSFTRSSETYQKMAEMFEPDTVLFHDWNARAPGFDRDLPDWTPREGYVQRVRELQDHGFRTMAYVNTYCVNYNSPVFVQDRIAEFGLTRKMGITNYAQRKLDQDQRSQWEGFRDGQLLYLDPLSPQWRTYHTDMMIQWKQDTGTDANYEDVLGTARDTGNGVVDGLRAGQGAVAQVQDMLMRNPDVPMASEYGPENVAFGVRWPLSYLTVWGSTAVREFWYQRTRPVSAYIHGPGLRPWVPILRTQDDVRRHWVMGWSDAYGGVAQLRASPIDLHAKRGALALMNYRAQLFSALQLEPHFESRRYPDDVVTMYRDKDGQIYHYRVTDTLQELLDPAGSPLYQRIHGRERITTPLAIRGWPARNGDNWFGLNPNAHYAAMPDDQQARSQVRVTSLPPGIMVRRYYDREHVSILALERIDETSPLAGSVDLFTRAPVERMLINDRLAAAPVWDESQGRSAVQTYQVQFPAYLVFFKDQVSSVARGYVDPDQRSGVHLIPQVGLELGVAYRAAATRVFDVPNARGSGEPGKEPLRRTSSLEEVVLDYVFEVPDDQTSVLLYLGNAQRVHGNGVIARLYLNGRIVRTYDFGAVANPNWESGMPSEQRNLWPEHQVHLWQVPLGAFAGQPVVLSLGTDSKNTTNADNFWWSRPLLLDDTDQQAVFQAVTEAGDLVDEEGWRVLPADFVMMEGRAREPGGY